MVACIVVSLLRNLGPPDMIFIGATALLAFMGIISPREAFAGFSNPGMLTVAALFVVAAALRDTGVLDVLGHRLLGRARTVKGVITRLGALVVPSSAFLNNTPIVAMFIPIVLDWSRRNRVPASRLLIPISYLAILGGTCTLIGTSTNLVMHGLMINDGLPGIGLFELSRIGIPFALVGLVYLLTIGQRLLPERKELLEQLSEARKEYLLEMLVQPGCRLAGQTVEEAGLRNLPGLYLIEIDRAGRVIGPVRPDDVINENDRLIFTGIVSSIIELEKIPGLVPAADPEYEIAPDQQVKRRLVEVVISVSSPLVGKTIREADFRTIYGAAVVAVHRSGRRIKQKIGNIELRPGDTLLLQVRPYFTRLHRNDSSFYLISDVAEWRPLRRNRAIPALLVFAGLLIGMTSNIVPHVVVAILAAFMMVFLRCISSADARQSIEWQVVLTIGAAFGVGAALQNSGAAAAIAALVVNFTADIGPVAALAVVYLLTILVTELITNNAAAVLIYPFAIEIALGFGVDARPFLIAVVLAASASFATPIGYQTNMMVYGAGGYRFTDFLKIGLPLSVITWLMAVLLIPVFWPF